MKAQIFPLYPFFFLFIFFFPTSQSALCPPLKCSPQGPEIRYPFRETARHPPHCGRPGFDLACEHNKTVFASKPFTNLAVGSISYVDRRVDLLDPRGCVHGVFMELNLSLTPFVYSYKLKDFDYLNCSARIVGGGLVDDQVECLSGEEYHVYTVESERSSSLDLPSSCKEVKTVAIPFGYTPYLAGDSGFGLEFSWKADDDDDDDDGGEMENESMSGGKNCLGMAMCGKWAKVALCVAAGAMLVSLKLYYDTKKKVEEEEEELENGKSHLFESLKGREGGYGYQ